MLELGRSGLLLALLLHLPHNGQGMDGCERGHWGAEYWKCGDICTYRKEKCSCGGKRFNVERSKWCCGGVNCEGGKCLEWENSWNREGDQPKYCAKWSPAVCTTGVVQNLNESCLGECNYHPEDKHRNSKANRSYMAACFNNTICVKEGARNTGYPHEYKPTICRGDSGCDGELQWCQSEERKNETCPGDLTRCPGLNRNQSISGQCIERDQMRDRETHCIDRSDEQ